jgi:general secretion pathway protein J
MRQIPRPGGALGFTLVELLVAVAILGMLLTVTFGVTRTASRSVDAGALRANATGDRRVSMDFLRRRLSTIVPVTNAEGDREFGFSGDASGFSFLAPAPRQAGSQGLFVYRIERLETSGGAALGLAYVPLDPGSADVEPAFAGGTGSRRLLIEGFDALTFSYFGSRGAMKERPTPPGWYEQWDAEEDGLPRLVGLSVSRTAHDSPDLVLALRTQVAHR